MVDFSMIGLVHPSEYNWKEQMLDVKKIAHKTSQLMLMVDVGKVMGLAQYAQELEKKVEELERRPICQCNPRPE